LCERAFRSLGKSILLLSQWKDSWDVIVAAAHEIVVTDSTLADAVASAAAVAVAAAAVDNEGSGQWGTNSHTAASLMIVAGDKELELLNENNCGMIQTIEVEKSEWQADEADE